MRIRKIDSIPEFAKVEELQKEVWGMDDRAIVPSHAFIATTHIGGILYGAYDEADRLIGFIYSVPGFVKGIRFHHCHMCGVVKDRRYEGVGYKLFLRLRNTLMKQGINLVTWTFDPLEGANANLYLSKLGAICREYLVNFYGSELRDRVNVGMETDRFYAEWFIKSRRVVDRIRGRLKRLRLDECVSKGARLVNVVELVRGLKRMKSYDLKATEDRILVQIPEDIQAIKASSLEFAREWRFATRRIFTHYLRRNYVVTDFISEVEEGRRNYYLLEKAPAGLKL